MINNHIKQFLYLLLRTAVFTLILEGSLRYDGAPTGYFNFLLPTTQGIYPPNTTIQNDWGYIPYTVQSNNLGLRNTGSLHVSKTPKKKRIVTIGDSVTEGFFVPDSLSYPFLLQDELNAISPNEWEVINCGKGGISIDVELAILKEMALELQPKVVVLTFSTNDIANLSTVSEHAIENTSLVQFQQPQTLRNRLFLWAVTQTALGETAYQIYWERVIKNPNRESEDHAVGAFEVYASLFDSLYVNTDGIVLTDEWTTDTQQLFDRYCLGLKAFQKVCNEHNIQLLFTYYPAYSQVYTSNKSSKIQHELQAVCEQLAIPFLDLTTEFQSYPGTALHFAPEDFHPNRIGNEVIADEVANKLISSH